jgi:two-component system sensor histidine kinase PilS (NtrC family)
LQELFGEITRDYLDSTVSGGSLLRSEVSFTRPDGAVARVGFNVAPLTSESDEIRGAVVIFQDLTEVYELEREVRRREKLSALGAMAAGLAHEIRNPLASIRGSAQVLAGEIEVDEAASRLLDIIRRESERLNRTLTDFLAFARPAPFSPSEFDVKQVISDAVALLKNSPEVGPNHKVVERYPNGPTTIVGDQNQIRQIFWNLARNALQAMPDGGNLKVSVESIGAGGCRLEVEDEGVGIPKQQIARLFEPFSSTKPGGTGLGMAIVYQFVQDHGGRVTVDSTVGVGTRVGVELRARSESMHSRDAVTADAKRERG